MIRFHNRVVDRLPGVAPPAQRFRRARKSVTLHYQWLIRHDYLPRIVQASVLDDVFTNGRKIVEPTARPTDVPTMPVEFSVAAFRLGHSMIRPAYDWNRRFPRDAGFLEYMFDFSALGGTSAATTGWPATGSRTGGGCTTSPPAATPASPRPSGVNLAQRIDTLLDRPAEEPAAEHVRRRRTASRSTTRAATWPSAT